MFARSRQRCGEQGSAEELYCEAIRRDPNCAEAWFLRSTVHLAACGERKDEFAIECLERAVQCSPNKALYHCNLGDALRRTGRLTEAERSLRRSLELEPTFAEAHRILGLILRQTDRLSEAQVSFEMAWKLQPALPGCAAYVIDGLRRSGRSAEALRFFHTAEKHLPKEAELTIAAARAFVDLQRVQEAVDLLRRRILGATSPGAVARLHATVAELYMNAGRHGEALPHLRTASELVPNSSAYEVSLAALMEMGGAGQPG